MKRVSRIDVGRLGTTERTSQGGVRVPAYLSRIGVQEYVRDDGSIQREFRPEDEVFSDASIQSAIDAIVTDFHQGMVNPANYREVTVGHVSGSPMPARDGDYLAATMVILDAAEIALIDAGERVENSCGYDCVLDFTPGITPNGEAYDAVQRNIQINHVALLPRGFGRAGEAVQLRLDAKGAPVMRLDSKGDALPLGAPGEKHDMTKPAKPTKAAKRGDAGEEPEVDLTTDGDTCATCGAPVDAEGKYVAPTTDADAEKAVAETEAKIDSLQAKLDTANETIAKLRKGAGRSDGADVEKAVRERASIERTAEKSGVAKLDGTNDELRRAVIGKVFPGRKLDGKSAAYVEATYDSACEVLASGEFRPTVEAKNDSRRNDSAAGSSGDVIAETLAQLEKDGV